MLKLPQMGPRSWEEAFNDPRVTGKARLALLGLRSRLGEAWSGWRAGAPLANRFLTGFQGREPDGLRIANAVAALADVGNIDLLVRKGVGSSKWSDFNAAVMALDFCGGYHAAGHHVEFIKNDHKESPDARVRLCARQVVVEFKALHQSDEEEPWDDLLQQLMDGLFRHRIALDRFRIEFEPDAIDLAEPIVEALVALDKSGAGEWLALPRGAGRARLVDGDPLLVYPFHQSPPTARIRLKLKGWCKQLAGLREPAVLVIQAENLFDPYSGWNSLVSARRLRGELRSSLDTKRMISGIVVYDEPFLGPGPKGATEEDGLRVVLGPSPRGFARVVMFVPNAAATHPLTEAEEDLLVGPNMPW